MRAFALMCHIFATMIFKHPVLAKKSKQTNYLRAPLLLVSQTCSLPVGLRRLCQRSWREPPAGWSRDSPKVHVKVQVSQVLQIVGNGEDVGIDDVTAVQQLGEEASGVADVIAGLGGWFYIFLVILFNEIKK